MIKGKPESPPEQAMPEYKVFPSGMWHMLGAIMLMIFSMASVVILVFEVVDLLVDSEIPPGLTFGGLVVMTVILSTPTFLLSRGWAKCHTFLLWLNALYLFVLAVGVGFFFLRDGYGDALTGLIGIVCAVGARLLYNSSAYHAGLEYYRLIWAHYRAGTNSKG